MRWISIAFVWWAAVLFCVACAGAEEDPPPERARVHEWPNSFDKIGAIELPMAIRSAAFSPDGRRIITSDCESSSLRVLNAETGTEERTIRLDGLPACGLKCMPDGRTLLMRTRAKHDAGEREGGDNRARQGVAVLDMATEKVLWSVNAPKSPSGYEACPADDSPDGRFLAVGDLKGNVQLWDLKERKLARVLTGHDAVYELVFSSDGQRLLVLDSRRQVVLWNVATGRQLIAETFTSAYVIRVGFSLDDVATVILRQEDGRIALKRLETRAEQAKDGTAENPEKGDGERLEGIANYFDKTRMSRAPSGWMWPHRTEAVSPNGKRTLTTIAGPCFAFLCILPSDGNSDGFPIAGDGFSIGQHGFTRDGRWAYAVVDEASPAGVHGIGYSLAFWDANTGAAAGQVTLPKAALDQIAWSDDEKSLLLMGGGRAWLWKNVTLPFANTPAAKPAAKEPQR
jgi:WD40 repeat protein